MNTRKFAIQGRFFSLPEKIHLSYTYQHVSYEPLAFRCPKKGEYFVSGAIPEIYIAPNDLSCEYLVVRVVLNPKTKLVYRID